MPDHSHLDDKYFVDRHIYNCPYCRRRHVRFSVKGTREFDWTHEKKCHVIFVECASCGNESMHLSWENIAVYDSGYKFTTDQIDDKLFYSVPTSLHAVDDRIPRILRELLTEAEGCLKSNFLTGASACARKVVYELAIKVGAEGANYEDRIKSLKTKLPSVDPTYFDTLLTIQQLTSEKVHENSYDGWESKHLKLILATLYEVMQEIYVIPKIREEKRKAIVDLKAKVVGGKSDAQKPEGTT
ncbi:MAG TPA: hypothetical protein VI699_01370 [Candidatus Acidoferrales bacterium]|nr:hypothetical protein [Candidatus Acidoferrales bacterium]